MKRKGSSSEDDFLSSVVDSVNKQFGAASLNTIDNLDGVAVAGYISFGHWGLDKIVSGKNNGGGAPLGRLTEIHGGYSSGKSLLISHLIAECQKVGGIAILDDTEHAYLPEFGAMVGVDNSKLLYSSSDTVEEVFDKMQMVLTKIIKTKPDTKVLYAWDSLALVPSAKELEDDVGGSGYNTEKAIVVNRGARKIVSIVGGSNVALIIANQVRHKLGVMFGNDETTPGGDAVPFWASVRIRLKMKKPIRCGEGKDDPIIGINSEALVVKNKIAAPFGSCNLEYSFDSGVKRASGSVDLLLREGIVTDLGAGYFDFNGQKYHGKKTLEALFNEDPSLLEDL